MVLTRFTIAIAAANIFFLHGVCDYIKSLDEYDIIAQSEDPALLLSAIVGERYSNPPDICLVAPEYGRTAELRQPLQALKAAHPATRLAAMVCAIKDCDQFLSMVSQREVAESSVEWACTSAMPPAWIGSEKWPRTPNVEGNATDDPNAGARDVLPPFEAGGCNV